MLKINWARVILGGLLAGLVINICEFLVNSLLLGDQWAAGVKSLGLPPMGLGVSIAFWVGGFVTGIFALWLYATLRGVFGAGPKTAIIAAIAVWIPATVLGSLPPIAMHMFRYRLMAIGIVLGLVELILGTELGAWLYKQESQPVSVPKAAAV
ncbi:MAG TPA: hypothetical protein VLY04_22005 [Bryobacteraceae bacterium]|nr:hypothetical protein [Bryobacteraceae bacterium]